MSTEIEVRNFQSIEHAHFTIEGYTAIAGRSNIGKSALVRAIKAALTGASGTGFVRHGPHCTRRTRDTKKCSCKSSVRIQREGFDLLWEKGDNDNTYTFNGKVYDSVERGAPSFILENGYAPIKIGDDKELLQVADQFDPIFLLNRTGGVIADVLSDVAHLDRINGATRLVEKDRREASSTRKVREQDVATLTQQLLDYDGLDDALARVRQVEDKLPEIDTADKRLKTIERFLEAATARAVEIKRLAGVENIEVPHADTLKSPFSGLERVIGWHDRLVAFKHWFERMKGLDALVVPDIKPLQEKLLGAASLVTFATRLERIEREVQLAEGACESNAAEVEGIRAEWEALGVCPTCAQPCAGHLEQAV
jgi:DNA repair ATPase RecN